MTLKALALGSAAFVATLSTAHAQNAAVTVNTPVAAAKLVDAIDIPYQTFTLKNGLRVVVHTDRKAPVVSVSVWYDVGSKHEPKGSTGFAHLFEHLMFNGSENAPGDFFEPLQQVGATNFNGTTSFDRTNYFETVPTAALPRVLFLESDRMGYLLGAITQGVLDEQRGVVQNEKRQRDNQPFGLASYKMVEGLYPADHPYGHMVIGSMSDLDKASLETVRNWFRSHYGPNNAVLVLAGDIDVATAKPMVERYFGAIAAGPKSVLPFAPVPTLPAPVTQVMKDRVAATRISRSWAMPGLDNLKESASLEAAAGVLGGLASSRLDTQLVRNEKLAVEVSANASVLSQGGTFTVTATVRPGGDADLVGRRLDAIIADFIKNGPTADEVDRIVISTAVQRIRGLKSSVGKATALAEGALYANDPGFYKKRLVALAAQTPASVRDAMQRWLTRPVYALTVVPGPRDAYEEAKVPPKKTIIAAPDQAAKGTRGPLPAVGEIAQLPFPTVTRDRLSNGIELVYAQRTDVPMTQVALTFDAGIAADVADKLGTQALTIGMMSEGTATLDGVALAVASERLGTMMNVDPSHDQTTFSLVVPSVNLTPGLGLFADFIRNPAFPDAEMARVKNQMLAGIDQELTDPKLLARRALSKLLDSASPYAKAQGSGDPKAVAALTRADLVAFQQAWLRPDKAKIFVVSERPLAEVKAAFEAKFGDWKGVGAPGVKDFSATPRPSPARIVLIDRPDSPQSLIQAGAINALKGTDDLLPVTVANDALGGSFIGRINMDLRENKHWTYGARGNFAKYAFAAPYVVSASVQQDKTGASIAAFREDVGAFVGDKPMTQIEFDRAIIGTIRSLSGSFETSTDVLKAMQANDLYRRPDDYYSTITQKYRALTLPQVQGQIRNVIDPAKFVWVVVGDASKVKPQLDTLGLPVEVVPAASVAGAK